MWLVFRYALAAVRAVARERRELSLENIALRHQIEVLTRNRRRPQLQPADRLLWSSLSRMWPSWRRHIVIVQPDTVVRWHRTVWRRYWRWKSRGGRRGRPRTEPELAELIRRMTQENPRWGHMRVLGELRKLGFRVSLLTVRRYRKDVPRDPLSSWRTFLENHRPEIWASDFFTVHTLWFQTLYVFFFVAHDRRTVMHVNVTAHPTATWVWRQLINATPWGNSPRFLIRDRDLWGAIIPNEANPDSDHSGSNIVALQAHGASAHVEARRTQLTNDADGAPPWMLSGDAQDQPLPLGGNVGTPRSATTLPAPVGAPSRTMPPHHRVRLDHHERASPAGPTACQ